MKRILSVITAIAVIIAAFVFAFADDELPAIDLSGGTWLRIGLSYGDSAVEEIQLACPDGFYIGTARNGFTLDQTLTEDAKDRTVITIGPDTYPNGTVLISAAADWDSRIVEINGKKYRDGLYVWVNGGKLNVINYVELEHYIWGVVGNEMSYAYPAEALKAQALTARSYAVAHPGKHASQGFDLCCTTDCQVYRGIASEYASTVNACRNTQGNVIFYDGSIASTFYYAASGGWTMNCEDVWTARLPYLRAVKDEYCSESYWSSSIDFETLRNRMLNVGYDCGEISSVEVSQYADNGAVYQLLVHTDRGDCTLTKNNVITVIGTSIVRTQFFSMSGSPDVSYEKKEVGGLNMKGAEGSSNTGNAVYVLGEDGEPVLVELADLSVSNGSGISGVSGDITTEYVFTHEVVDTGILYFKGIGNGHGVGLPQTSARNMALQGFSADAIIKYYYTGVEIAPYKPASSGAGSGSYTW